MPLYLGDSVIINGQNATVSGDFVVQEQNLRDSVEHSDIIPCDGSVFGDTMAPLVMSDSQMTEVGYNGWLGNNHFNTGVINWNVRLPGSYPQNQIRYITCAAKLLSYTVQPQFIVHGLDSAGNAITNTYSSSTLSSSDGRLIYYVIPIADTYANYDCFELPGHTKIVTTTADTSTFATITNVVIHSVSHPTLGALNMIVKEVNYITNQNTGTISYKFANDSVVQARSAQAVAALYAAIYNKDVTQVQANILAAITRSGAGYNGNVASGVYGDTDVLANYTRFTLAYDSNEYILIDINGNVVTISAPSTTPTGTTFVVTSGSLPNGVSINSANGSITYDTSQSMVIGDYAITVTATNLSGEETTFDMTLHVQPYVNYDASSYTATSRTSLTSIVPVSKSTTNGYSKTGALPAGVSFNTSSGVFTHDGSSTMDANTYAITVNATDGVLTSTDALSIIVNHDFQYADTWNVGTSGSATFSFSNGTTSAGATYAITNHPAGMSVNSTTAEITANSIPIGNFPSVTITGTSSDSTITRSETINVTAPLSFSYGSTSVTITDSDLVSANNWLAASSLAAPSAPRSGTTSYSFQNFTLNGSSVTPANYGFTIPSGTIYLNSTPPGSYSATVLGTNAGQSHTHSAISFEVPLKFTYSSTTAATSGTDNLGVLTITPTAPNGIVYNTITLPAITGLSGDTSTGIISLVDVAPGDYSIDVTAELNSKTRLLNLVATVPLSVSGYVSSYTTTDLRTLSGIAAPVAPSGTTFAISGEPTGVTIDSTSGAITQDGSPMYVGSHSVTVTGTYTNGSYGTKTDSESFNIIVADPTVTISYVNNRTSDTTILSTNDTATITLTFSDNLTDSFIIGQLSSTSGTLSNLNGSDAIYTVTFTPDSGVSTTSAGVSMSSFTGFNSVSGNTTIRGTSLANMNVDTVAPTMTIASTDATSGGSYSVSSYNFTFTSNQPIQNFVANDVTITGGVGSIAFGDSILDDNADTIGYHATFTVYPSATGEVNISVAADKFTNAAGNNNTASDTFTFTQTE